MDASAKSRTDISPDLLAQVAKGHQPAFEALYDQSHALLFTLALRVLGDPDEAAELLQEVYLEVWRKVVRYDVGRGSPMAWLVTLTRSRAIDRLRSRTSKGHGMTDPLGETVAAQLQAQTPSPFESQLQYELRTCMQKALAELPDGQQRALELAYYQGLSHTEIAARLKEPVGTIKTRIKLGMSKLKVALQPWLDQA
jgi:RNA polymerase sigma-70 factor, ECF subfamily